MTCGKNYHFILASVAQLDLPLSDFPIASENIEGSRSASPIQTRTPTMIGNLGRQFIACCRSVILEVRFGV